MYTEAEQLALLLNKKYLAEPQNELYERESGNKKKQVISLDFKGCDFFKLYRFDREKSPYFLDFLNFENSTPARLLAFCDYVLICVRDGEIFEIFIELTRGNSKTDSYAKEQCQAAIHLFDYIEKCGRRVYGNEFCQAVNRRSLLLRRDDKRYSRNTIKHHFRPQYDNDDFDALLVKDRDRCPCKNLCI